jgi:ABC-type Mn2+/Zn2+ transport system permease subunit
MSATLPGVAGITSTVVFAFSTVPMLVKAGRTRDLSSYSLGNIVLVNVGNVVHTVCVFHLPVGSGAVATPTARQVRRWPR